jgi:hypothetical protein
MYHAPRATLPVNSKLSVSGIGLSRLPNADIENEARPIFSEKRAYAHFLHVFSPEI